MRAELVAGGAAAGWERGTDGARGRSGGVSRGAQQTRRDGQREAKSGEARVETQQRAVVRTWKRARTRTLARRRRSAGLVGAWRRAWRRSWAWTSLQRSMIQTAAYRRDKAEHSSGGATRHCRKRVRGGGGEASARENAKHAGEGRHKAKLQGVSKLDAIELRLGPRAPGRRERERGDRRRDRTISTDWARSEDADWRGRPAEEGGGRGLAADKSDGAGKGSRW
ncbi:hypothetical protein C8Q78DRAFT_699941 [Trametes maxima]|nr:hypothetical protein C8Q78DRAFT_699941 [Trametes maxima]